MKPPFFILNLALFMTIFWSLSNIHRADVHHEVYACSDSLISNSMDDSSTLQNYRLEGWDAMNLKGRVKNLKEVQFNVSQDILYTYGQIRESTTKGSDTYVFSDKGNTIEHSSYWENGMLHFKKIFFYDSYGRVMESTSYNKKEKVIGKTNYHYDKSGYFIEDLSFASDGSVKRKNISRYDVIKNQTEETCFNSSDKIDSKYLTKFGGSGNPFEYFEIGKSGKVLFESTYRYDKNNNLIETITIDSKGYLLARLVNQYTFDSVGNWIKKITYLMDMSNAIHKNDRPLEIQIRTFEYF
jgi:hypothetical protein